jgi:hypothetical protein
MPCCPPAGWSLCRLPSPRRSTKRTNRCVLHMYRDRSAKRRQCWRLHPAEFRPPRSPLGARRIATRRAFVRAPVAAVWDAAATATATATTTTAAAAAVVLPKTPSCSRLASFAAASPSARRLAGSVDRRLRTNRGNRDINRSASLRLTDLLIVKHALRGHNVGR